MQENKNALKRAYLKTLKYLSLIAIPAAFGIAVIAWDFVKVVYGDKWFPAVAGASMVLGEAQRFIKMPYLYLRLLLARAVLKYLST